MAVSSCSLESIQAQLQEARAALFLPQLRSLTSLLTGLAHETADVPLLARTHGQAASPTTLGKEVAIMAHRIGRAVARFAEVPVGLFVHATFKFNSTLSLTLSLSTPLQVVLSHAEARLHLIFVAQ